MDILKKYVGCCSSNADERFSAVPTISAEPTKEQLEELFNEVQKTLEQKEGDRKKVHMPEEVQKNASHLKSWIMNHSSEGIAGLEISREILDKLGSMHWVCVGLTVTAMALNMTIKMHDNKDQCDDIIKESLQLWKRIMKPLLENKEGHASEFIQESVGLIIEGYLYCKKLLDSRKLKRFIFAESQKAELELWKEKLKLFWIKANAVISVDIREKLLVPHAVASTTFETTLGKYKIITPLILTIGLEERKSEVMKMLNLDNKDETRIVVLHGMGGVGKSTLGDAVYNQVSFSGDRCQCHIKLDEKPTREHITKLQKQMVENLTGKSLSKTDPEAIREQLRQVLLDKERDPVLIYIDNVLQLQDLENFLPLECERITLAKGSRWLVTTRDESVCTMVFERNQGFKVEKFSVKLMNDSDARKLFLLHALGQEEPSFEMVETYDDNQGLIGEMTTSICGNLPLALRLLGRSLYKKNVSVWRKTRDDIKNHGRLGLEELVSNVLKLSYNNLNVDTQTAFLLICVCFAGSRYNIANDVVESILPRASTFRLIELGLIEPHLSIKDGPEAISIKVHDIVRALGYEIAVQRKCAPIKMPSGKQDLTEDDECWSSIKWLRVPPLEDGIEAAFLEQCRQLEVFVLDTHVHGKIENTPPQLKVVITNSSCPLELQKLKKLVYLDAEEIQEFPVAANSTRSCLQVLRGFSGGSISMEAIDSHKNNLRKLTACGRLMELTPYFCQHMSKLQSLEILNFEGDNLPGEMGNLASLEALRIHSKTMEDLPRSLEKLTRLQFLQLHLKNVKVIPRGILGAMRQLGYLELQFESPFCTALPMQDIGQLASLEVLLLGIPRVKSLTTTRDQLVPVLSLKLPKLKLLVLASDDMHSLENVELSCPSLKHLFLSLEKLQVLPPKFMNDLAKLQALTLYQCNELEELPSQMRSLSACLESLLLLRCRSLKALPEGFMESLQSLVVLGCPALLQLPHDLDQEKARSMKDLVCDKSARLLTTEMLSLPNVVAPDGTSSANDPRAQQFLSCFQDMMVPSSPFFMHWSQC